MCKSWYCSCYFFRYSVTVSTYNYLYGRTSTDLRITNSLSAWEVFSLNCLPQGNKMVFTRTRAMDRDSVIIPPIFYFFYSHFHLWRHSGIKFQFRRTSGFLFRRSMARQEYRTFAWWTNVRKPTLLPPSVSYDSSYYEEIVLS